MIIIFALDWCRILTRVAAIFIVFFHSILELSLTCIFWRSWFPSWIVFPFVLLILIMMAVASSYRSWDISQLGDSGNNLKIHGWYHDKDHGWSTRDTWLISDTIRIGVTSCFAFITNNNVIKKVKWRKRLSNRCKLILNKSNSNWRANSATPSIAIKMANYSLSRTWWIVNGWHIEE